MLLEDFARLAEVCIDDVVEDVLVVDLNFRRQIKFKLSFALTEI